MNQPQERPKELSGCALGCQLLGLGLFLSLLLVVLVVLTNPQVVEWLKK